MATRITLYYFSQPKLPRPQTVVNSILKLHFICNLQAPERLLTPAAGAEWGKGRSHQRSPIERSSGDHAVAGVRGKNRCETIG